MLHHRKILRSVLSIMLLLSVASVAVASSGGVTFQDIAAGGGAGITYHRVESPSDALFDALKQQFDHTFRRAVARIVYIAFEGDAQDQYVRAVQ